MAKKVKPQAKAKKKPGKPLAKAPAEYVFWCRDGGVFTDLSELAEGLAAMSDETFAYHSNLEKHDFSNWIRDVIGDEQLADEVEMITSRLQAAACVMDRIN
jgi:hypothetical protein